MGNLRIQWLIAIVLSRLVPVAAASDVVHTLSEVDQALRGLKPHVQSCSPEPKSTPAWLSLRECQRSLAVTFDGIRIQYGWSGPGSDGILFMNCDDNYDLGQDQYVYTPSGVYHFLIKTHRDYKGGMEPTQFRLRIEGKPYYFVSNIAGAMGDLYDSSGKALEPEQYDPADLTYSIAKKKPVLDYYHKVLIGSSAPDAALVARAPDTERLGKAESCLRKEVLQRASDLASTFKIRFAAWKTPEATRKEKLEFLEQIFRHSACTSDPEMSGKLEAILKNARESAD